MPFDERVQDLVTRIHATPHRAVLAFAGAGSQALAWLHGVGGSSRTILSAIDIYSPQSMRHLLGFMPAKFTSRRVARLMAAAAYDRAWGSEDLQEGLAAFQARRRPQFKGR